MLEAPDHGTHSDNSQPLGESVMCMKKSSSRENQECEMRLKYAEASVPDRERGLNFNDHDTFLCR